MPNTSATSNGKPRLLIVGSGPAGLILALSLLKNGISVRVVEKTLTPRIGQRGPGVMEVFEFLSIIDEVNRLAIVPAKFRMYNMPEATETLKDFNLSQDVPPSPDIPYPNLRMLGQDEIDRILRTEMRKYECEAEYGVECQSLQEVDHGVRVTLLKHGTDTQTEEAVYEYVVGTDGAKSTVRKQLGLTFLGETGAENFVVGDVKMAGLSNDRWHVFGEMRDIALMFRPIGKESVMNLFLGGTKLDNFEEILASEDKLREFIKERTGNREDIKIAEVICLGHYRRAHIHTPAGGQGMNTSVQDAFNLGWKLGLVMKRHALPALLDTYTEERLPVIAEMLSLTTLFMNRTIADFAGTEDRGDALKQLGVNYRSSSIVFDDEKKDSSLPDQRVSSYYIQSGGYVQAGDRAPDAPGLVGLIGDLKEASTRLFKLFNPTRHTLLIFADKVSSCERMAGTSFLEKHPEELIQVVVITAAESKCSVKAASGGGQPRIFEDRDGHAHKVYDGPAHKSAFFVIRPDGVVGARVGKAARLEDYFKGVFGK